MCPTGFQHLAVIMDGNGRWAEKKGRPRYFGHFRGVKAFRQVVKDCSRMGIPCLTVFAFSTENWKRSLKEVSIITRLMKRTLIRHSAELMKYDIRLHILGDIDAFDRAVQDLFHQMCEKTKNNQGLQLIVAVNYGGKREIIQGVRALAGKIQAGQIKPEEINENIFSRYLPSSAFPPPDLIIRTGAVSRLSNFYLWSAAYSEIYVSPVLWPDFDTTELERALESYTRTQRRFGAATTEDATGGGSVGVSADTDGGSVDVDAGANGGGARGAKESQRVKSQRVKS